MTVATSHVAHDHHLPFAGGDGTPSPPATAPAKSKQGSPGDSLAHDQTIRDAQAETVVGDPSPLSAIQEPTPIREAPAGDPLAHDHTTRDTHGSPVVGEPSSPPPAIGVADTDAVARLGERLELWAFHQGTVTSLAETVSDLEQSRIAITHRIGAINRDMGRKSNDRVEDDPETERLWLIADGLKAVEDGAVKELEIAMKAHPLGPWMKTTPGIGLKRGARLLAAVGNPYWNQKADRPRRGPAELWAYCGYSVLPASQAAGDAQTRSAGGQSLQVTQVSTETHAIRGDLQSPATSQTRNDTQGRRAGGQSLAPDHLAHEVQTRVVGGDPSHPTDHATPDDQTRPVGGVAQRRRKGVRSNWNNQAKMRAYLVAESCVLAKKTSPYGPLYEEAKAKYASAIHVTDCPQCSVCATCGQLLGKTKAEHLADHGCDKRKARHAGPGSPLTPGHQLQRAKRLIAKEVLKDMFLQAKAWHLAPDQEMFDTHGGVVGGGVPTPEAAS